jgi:two-component system, NarL family, response regulator NreC
MTKVFIVDDHALIRKGIAMMLNNYDDIFIIGEAEDGLEACRLIEQQHPDVVILDISMPGSIDGFMTAARIKAISSKIKIIALTMYEEEGYIRKAAELKIEGYILKRDPNQQIYEAVQQVARGKKVYRTSLPDEMIQALHNNKTSAKKKTLTKREEDILSLMVNGYSNQEIAEKLYISPKTVENHKFNMMNKLEMQSRSELIQYGIKNNLLQE